MKNPFKNNSEITIETEVSERNSQQERDYNEDNGIVSSFLSGCVFSLRSAWQNALRHRLLTLTSIFTTLVTLIIVYFSLGINFTTTYTIDYLGDLVDINVPLKSSASENEIDKLMNDIQLLPYTKSVEFKSRDEALTEFQSKYERLPDFLSTHDLQNPLPNFIKVQTESPSDISKLLSVLSAEEYVNVINTDSLSFDEEYETKVDSFVENSTTVANSSMVITIIFVVLSLLIVVTTIKMTLHNRSKALKIMRIVGASNYHIEFPFIIEGIMYGLVAFLLSMVPFSIMKQRLVPVLADQFNVQHEMFATIISNYYGDWWLMLIISVIVFNAVSSWLVVRQYMSSNIVL